MQSYKRGKADGPVAAVRDCDPQLHGTKVHFLPDAEIFEETVYDYNTRKQRLRENCFSDKRIYASRYSWYSALTDGLIIFLYGTILDDPAECLGTGQRLSAQYDTAGIAVEAVADRWMESGKIGFFYGIGSQQVANQPFVQGKIFRFGFLGQNSGRFIQQQDIFIPERIRN